MLELLGDSTYIRYWLAVVVSFLGDAITRVTLIYVAATLTDAPELLISLVIIAQLLPSGVFGTFIGPLADHVSKRVLLVGSDLARILIVLAMIPALHSAPLLLLLIFVEGIAKAFFETARISAIPTIVGSHSIPSAIALFQSTNHTLNLVGPAIGGLLIAASSVPTVLVIDAVTFLISGLLLGSMGVLKRVPGSGPVREPYWTALSIGVRGVWQVPSLRFLAAFLVPVMLVLGLFTTNFNAQLLTVFELAPFDYGLGQAMLGAGSILAVLFGPRLVRRFSAHVLLIGSVVLFGVALVALGPTDWLRAELGLGTIVFWCALAGLGSALFQVPMATTMLRDLPEDLRGRGVGLMNALMMTFTIAGVVLGTVTGELLGTAGSIIAAGVVLLAAGAGLLLAVPSKSGVLR